MCANILVDLARNKEPDCKLFQPKTRELLVSSYVLFASEQAEATPVC